MRRFIGLTRFPFGRWEPHSWRLWPLLDGMSLMRIRFALLTVLIAASTVYGDAYTSLLRRYEKQIQQQKKQLASLRGRLQEKEIDVARWKNKADDAKAALSEASASLEETRAKVKLVHAKRQEVRIQADAAQWKTTENTLISHSATTQARVLAQDLYGKSLVARSGNDPSVEDASPEFVLNQVSALSASSERLADASQKEEAALRTDEMRLQNEEQARSLEAGKIHHEQENQWLRWQEALRRKTALEDEISQIDQSAKALQVMLQELKEHRDQARALRGNRCARH